MTPAPGATSAPGLRSADGRTRSIWLTQLVLAAAVVVTNVLVLALQPEVFAQWNYALGSLALVVLTIATLAIPWARLPRAAVIAVPALDAIAIGLVASSTDLRFSYLWVFPVMWVAMHFAISSLAGMLALIGVIMLIDAVLNPTGQAGLRVFIVLVSLTFIGITAHLAMRQTRALRRLLRRQAERLNVSLGRRSDQERRTNEILNGVETGIARISASGAILTVNDAYSRLYGLDPLDRSLPARAVEYTGLRGMPIPLSDRPFSRAARGETFRDAAVWLFTPEGEWRALTITATHMSAAPDDERSILLLVQDVTAITYAQRERERLVAMASHELKHPLTVMIGNAELALESDDLAPRTRTRLEAIVGASERMLEMTNSMLKSSRTGYAGREAFDDIDLRGILLDSVASFRPTAASHEVAIDVRLDEPLPLSGDGFRLRQVVDNLVSNAIKYTPGEGMVRVTGTLADGSVEVVVRDTGIGIAAEDLPHIMTPYFRTTAAKETASGTGLGLGITKEIVAAHGGTLTIDSATGSAGAGTTVTVRLPTAAAGPRAQGGASR